MYEAQEVWYDAAMNNDFNYKPQQRPTNDQYQQSDQLPEAQEGNVAPPPPRKKRGFFKKFFTFIGLLVLIALVGGGVYLWQQMQLKDASNQQALLQQKVSSLESEVKKAAGSISDTKTEDTAATVENTGVITGMYTSTNPGDDNVDVTYKANVSEVWVEFGSKPDDLSAKTKPLTEGVAIGVPGDFTSRTFKLANLDPGERYFYRAAAKVDGKTVYGGIAAFTTKK